MSFPKKYWKINTITQTHCVLRTRSRHLWGVSLFRSKKSCKVSPAEDCSRLSNISLHSQLSFVQFGKAAAGLYRPALPAKSVSTAPVFDMMLLPLFENTFELADVLPVANVLNNSAASDASANVVDLPQVVYLRCFTTIAKSIGEICRFDLYYNH